MTSEETGDRERLLFHLENQTGFWFALVIGDDVGPRARLRKVAESWCKDNGRTFVLHEPDPGSLAALAVALAREPKPGLHWIRADGPQGLLEQWDAAAAQLLLAMNERREAYRKRLDGGVVIEGRESLKRLLRDLAPDLFSIRAFIAEPRAKEDAHGRAPSEWHYPVSLVTLASVGLDPDRELQRASWLEGLEGLEAKNEWFGAALRAVAGLVQAKRFEEAEARGQGLCADTEKRLRERPDGAELRRVLPYLRMILGICAYGVGKARVALQRFDEAIEAAAPCLNGSEDEVTAVNFMLLVINKLRGSVLVDLNDLEGAADAFRDYLDIVEQILERSPSNMEMRLEAIGVHRSLTSIWLKKNDLGAAEIAIRTALAIAERNSLEHPGDERWQSELAQTWHSLGVILFSKGESRAALDAANAATSVAIRFVRLDASNKHWQEELGRDHVLVTLALCEQGDFSAVNLPAQEQALTFTARRFEQDPDDIDAGWLVVTLYVYRAGLLEEQGDASGVREAIDQAWKLARRLPARHKKDRKLRRAVASMRPREARKSKKK